LARGDGPQALVALTEGLRLKPADPDFLARLDEMKQTAEAGASRAQTEAIQGGAADVASTEYQQAVGKLAEASRLQRSQTPDAIRRFWEATDLFGHAKTRAGVARKVQQNEEEAHQREQQATDARRVEREAADARQREQEAAEARRREQQAADTRREQETLDARRREQEGKALQARLEAERAIEQVLARYVAAYNALDSTAVAQLVPSQSANQLAQQFAQVRSYNLTLVGTRIELDGDSATVTCVRQIDQIAKRANQPNHQAVGTTFKLRRSGGSWVIENVSAH
jgi:hypothetical protein